MTATEILKETKEFYEADPNGRRALNGGACMYKSAETGSMCAVGRKLLDIPTFIAEIQLVTGNPSCATFSLAEIADNNWEKIGGLDQFLEEECRGLPFGFWVDLQEFHDNYDYWGSNGLTLTGQAEYNRLARVWGDR